MAVHLRRPAFIEGTQRVELMRNIYYKRLSRTCNTDSGIVRWTRNAASANVSFKQTSTEYHQPKKSQLPIKSNANILGLGFYPVIINKD